MLRLDRVTAGYGETTVLRNVTLAVPAGSIVALIGPNGAGKTTSLRVASGLLPPASGRLLIDGADATGRAPYRLAEAGICHIPEGRGVFPDLSVRENLLLFTPPGHEEEGLARAIDAFPRLGERLSQRASTMSGGEQQMLALARSYTQRPSLVLLDEVSMGLAPKIVEEIFAFLARLAADGAALLLVEQYVTKALAMADYVYVLERGRIAFAGEPAELDGTDVFAHYLGAEVA
jgi:branched-chain amino acid transport system ATP-binding protein